MLVGDEEPEEESTTLALPQEYTALAQLLMGPQELTTEWSLEGAAAHLLPKKKSSDYTELEVELTDYRPLLDLQTRKVVTAPPEEVAATKKKVDATERAYEKAKADSAVALAACELEVSLKQHAKEDETRVSRADAAELKAGEHSDRLEEICRGQASAWETHLLKLQTSSRATERPERPPGGQGAHCSRAGLWRCGRC